jgi:hypothetical protein
MSFIEKNATVGKTYAPGWFLASEDCKRETRQIAQAGATSANGGKYQKMGSFYPANNSSTVEGILYEDVDVTSGDMPGSVVTEGIVYLDRLPAAPESGVQNALEGKGFKFIATSPSTVRPEFPTSLTALTVTSTASATADGKTAIAVSGVTLKSGEKYAYKIDTEAPTVNAGDKVDNTWTKVDDFSTEITSTDGKKIAVVALTKAGECYAYGSATVDVK